MFDLEHCDRMKCNHILCGQSAEELAAGLQKAIALELEIANDAGVATEDLDEAVQRLVDTLRTVPLDGGLCVLEWRSRRGRQTSYMDCLFQAGYKTGYKAGQISCGGTNG
jgi:hypothetical protein